MNKYESPLGCVAVESVGIDDDCLVCCLKPKDGEFCDQFNCSRYEREDKCDVHFEEIEVEEPLTLLMKTFDDVLSRHPHLVFEIGYNRVTDWMVSVWDSSKVGIQNSNLAFKTQSPVRAEAFYMACEKLRNWVEIANENH